MEHGCQRKRHVHCLLDIDTNNYQDITGDTYSDLELLKTNIKYSIRVYEIQYSMKVCQASVTKRCGIGPIRTKISPNKIRKKLFINIINSV